MTLRSGNGGGKVGVTSLRELSRDVAPPRDLWPAIASRIDRENRRASFREAADEWWLGPTRMQWAALAAVVAALAIGMWAGRNLLPLLGPQAPERVAEAGGAQILAASFVTDPRYLKEHAALVRELETQLKSLPPETQHKVASSLGTIRKSMHEIQTALGGDPGNALLQELLVNTYQDEMRVLTAVREAGDARQEI